ncbi:MAG TPA: glycosyltransferase family 4 protein [Planctomycetaceae bacterium]|nr:glycosyltransferase family 4 protein [Planctomycetaceae bacterium]
MKTAVVLDWIAQYGGAEKVVEQLLASYPESDLYALVDALTEEHRRFLQGRPVQTCFIQRWKFLRKRFRNLLPLMPLLIEQYDLGKYDVVISSSHAIAKGVLTRCDQLHVCYIHTPVRYAWDLQHEYLNLHGKSRGIVGMITRAVLHYLRMWDRMSADRPDLYVTNSKYVARRVRKTYSRPSVVIYPPVDVEAFSVGTTKENFYVTAQRMVPYKRVDLIVEAFTAMPDRELVVIGEGPEYKRVAAKAGPNVKLLGYQPQEVLCDYLQRAKAYVFAADEDFGISPVEAQACGTPVIAYGVGGVTESVIDGVTGTFFGEQTAASLIDAVQRFERQAPDFDPRVIRAQAERFSNARFRSEFEQLMRDAWECFSAGQSLDEFAASREEVRAPALAR